MRSASSKNFSLNDLREISAICKENNVRTYLTLNSVVYDNEMDEIGRVVDAARENHINAVIASDQAVIQYCRKAGMKIHMSTQTNISNLEAVRYYSQFADVMVTARELNLDQVKAITKGIETEKITGPSGELARIEVFAHGALCMAISGKCYLSLDNLNYSANRGQCLQVCRRPYKVFDQDGGIELEIDNEYIMSPKDLKTIDFLDKILDAGVRVLKIEGRGRSPEYVKTVTRCYKEAVTAWFNNEYSAQNIELWNQQLRSVYNRGFWDGYYLGRRMGEWSDRYGSQATHTKIYVGKITNYFTRLGVAEVTMETGDLNTGDDILIIGPTTGVVEEQVKEIRVGLIKVNKTVKGEICSIPVKTFLRRSDKVYKRVLLNLTGT